MMRLWKRPDFELLRLAGQLLLFAVCGISLTVLTSQLALCQESQPQPRPDEGGDGGQSVQPDLPDGAIWRFGEFGQPHRSNGFYRMEFSPDGRLLALRNQDYVVLVVDVEQRQQLWEFDGHEGRVESLSFSPDNQYLVTAAGANEMVKIWNLKSGKLDSQIKTNAQQAFFNSLGNRIYVLGDTHVETYSWPGGQLVSQKKWKTGSERALGLSPDGRQVATVRSLARNVYQTMLLDLESQTKVQLAAPPTLPRSVAFSADRNWIAINYQRDPRTRLWDLRDPHHRKYSLDGHDDAVQALTFSDDSRYLLTTSWDDTAILFDVVSQQQVKRLKGHTENVNACDFVPLEFELATGASGRTDSSLILWNYQDVVRMEVSRDADNFDQVWEGLAHQDYQPAMEQVTRLVLETDRWWGQVEALVERETEVKSLATISDLIQQLDGSTFAERESATMKLIKLRVQADSQLRLALEEATSPEVRMRLARVLEYKVQRPPRDDAKQRRWARLVFALEQINNADSNSLLKRIADGHNDIDIARSAASAWERNQLRAGSE